MFQTSQVLTVTEAARILQISPSTCYAAIRRGEIPSIRLSRTVRVPKRAVEDLVGLDPVGAWPIGNSLSPGGSNPSLAMGKPYRRPLRDMSTDLRFIPAPELARQKSPAWLIDQVLVNGTHAVLAGLTGKGKSTIALQMAASVATGTPWFGYKAEKGKVLFVAAEGQGDWPSRVVAATAAVSRALSRLSFLTKSMNLMDVNEVENFIFTINENMPGLKLIVFDPLQRLMPGGEENWAKDIGMVNSNLDSIRDQTGATILLLHHFGKDGTLRGSTALPAAADTVLEIRGVRSQEILRLVCQKQRSAAPFPDLLFRLAPVKDSVTPVPVDPSDRSPQKKRVLDALKAEKEPISFNALRKVVKMSTSGLGDIAEALVSDPSTGVKVRDGANRARLYWIEER